MKRLLLLTLIGFAPLAQAETTVDVTINNVIEGQGRLVVHAYDSKKAWLKKIFAEQTAAPVEGAVVRFLLPEGSFAFQVYQDLDDNGKMKTNWIGIPKEPTGVSNEAKGKFGPPKFKDAAIEIGTEPAEITLTLVSID